MGIMTFLRNRAGFILIAVIGLAIVAFIIGDVAKTGESFWAASQKEVGSIDGNSIDITAFQAKVDQQKQQLEQQYQGQMGSQVQAMAVENVWNQQMSDILLSKEYDKLGIQVSANELFGLIQGANPSPLIRQYFTDPKTGVFNVEAVRQALEQRKTNPQMEAQWVQLENQIEQQALQQKYGSAIRNGIYITNLEADAANVEQSKSANFAYVGVDYTSVPDQDVKVSDEDYQSFYNDNAGLFNNDHDTRDFEYVVFTAKPSVQDSADSKKQIEQMAEDFKKSTNDSLFAAVNSDVKVPFRYLTKGKLDQAVDEAVFNMPVGSFYGPVLNNGSYKLVKLVATTTQPDSVNASHILINPAAVSGAENALKLADSLKNLIQKGANFEELAKQYSTDGSKDKGGELGTFTSDKMIPEFSSVAFAGKAGDLKVITTQYGVHVLKINKTFGAAKAVKLAYIEKALAPSSSTQELAYKNASQFLNDANSSDFSKAASKNKVKVQLGDKITATQAYVPGLSEPRKVIQEVWKAKKGDIINQVFTNDNDNVVVRVADVNDKGQLPLSAVKNAIKPSVINMLKAKMLKAKVEAASKGASDLNQVAAKLGVAVSNAENVVFANPIVTGANGVSQEPELVGAVFASAVNKVSKPIAGQKGVYVFNVAGFATSAPVTNYPEVKARLLGTSSQAFISGVMTTLQNKADIKDNRVKFY